MITMSPEDEALLYEAVSPIEELGRKAKSAPDLDSARRAIDAAWSVLRHARQLTNDIEQRTRWDHLSRGSKGAGGSAVSIPRAALSIPSRPFPGKVKTA